MADKKPLQLKNAIQQGLLSGLIVLSLSVIGLVALFGERYLIIRCIFTWTDYFIRCACSPGIYHGRKSIG